MPAITVAWSPGPRHAEERSLQLPEGATLADALAACSVPVEARGEAAVWGRKAEPGQVLRDGDRVEVLRPLRVDPKVARRERFRKQGSRAAGLFAARRPGGKAGY